MNNFTKQAYFARVLENTFQKQADVMGAIKGLLGGGLNDFSRAGAALFGKNIKGAPAVYNLLKGLGVAARGAGRIALPIAGAGLAGYGALKAMQFAGRGAKAIDDGVSHWNARRKADRAAAEAYKGRHASLNKEQQGYADSLYKGDAEASARKAYKAEVDSWF